MQVKWFGRLVLGLLISQMLLSPVAQVWAEPNHNEVPATVESAFSEADALKEAADLNAVIDGTSNAVRNRLDTFGLFDWESPEKSEHKGYVDIQNLVVKQTASQSLEISLRGKLLVKSRFAVQAFARHGDYLVFIEPDTYTDGGLDQEVASTKEKGIQRVSFVDLKTYGQLLGLGTAEVTLPVFTLPVATNAAIDVLRSAGDTLSLMADGQVNPVPTDVFKGFSDAQQTALNVTAALVNPETYEYAKPVVEETEKYFLKTIHLAKKNFSGTSEQSDDFAKALTKTLVERKPEARDILESPQLHKTINGIQSFMEAQRKATARVKLLWARLSLPRPMEAPMRIREALAMVVAGLTANDLKERGALTQEGMLQLLHNRYVRWGVGVAAAAALGLIYPQQVHHHFYQALDIGGSVLSSVGGRAKEMGKLAAQAAKLGFDGFTKPSVFYKAYLTPEKRAHFVVGMTGITGTALAMMGSAFVVTNSWLLVRSLKDGMVDNFKSFRGEGEGVIGAVIKTLTEAKGAFIARQRAIQLESLRNKKSELEEEAKARGAEIKDKFSEADEAELGQIFEEIRLRDQGWISKFFDKVKEWNLFKRKNYAAAAENPEEDVKTTNEDAEERLTNREIHDVGSSLKHFIYGESSLVEAASVNTRGWNGFEILRLSLISPTMFLALLTTPNFYNVSIGSVGNIEVGKLTLPTKLNGGTINPYEATKRAFKTLTFDRDLKVLHAWETKIIPVEKVMIEAAIKESYKGLVQYIEGKNHSVESLIRTAGIRHFTDPDLETLSLSQRTFFRAYVDQLLEKSMQKFLTGVARQTEGAEIADDLSTDELKKATITQIDALKIEAPDAAKLVSEVAGEGAAFAKAENIADHAFKNLHAWTATNLKHATLAKIDPENNLTTKQIQIRLQQLGSKAAVSRAVRAVMPKVLMKKTIGFMFTLFGLAGVTSGVMQPLHEEMFGPNSYFYMGKVPFVSGLLVGLYITLYEGIPQKLQRDYSHAKHFNDEYPKGKDAEAGFLRWYFKRTFLNSNNKWWDNQKIHWRVFFGQLIPSTVLYFFTGMASLGRFDLDGFIAHFFLSTASPANGLDVKLEQGMEYASTFPLKDFPEKYHSHPRVREYLARWQLTKRFWFSFWEMLYVDARNQVLYMMVRMNDLQNNTQAFLRLFDPESLTPTERVARFVDKGVVEPLKKVPIVGAAGAAIASYCESLLTKGYQDYQRYKPDGWVKSEKPKGNHH